jgi:hypothetical protein
MDGINGAQSTIESVDEFDETKKGQYERWQAEMQASESAFKKFIKQGTKTNDRYLGKHPVESGFQLNLYHANIETMQSMMFGKLPDVGLSRKHADADDDVARVAGMMLERMLNADIGRPNDQYSTTLRKALQDRLIVGLGNSRVRYDYDEEEVEVAAVVDLQGQELEPARVDTQITNERAPIEYVHWRDRRWSPCKTWEECRWDSYRTLLTRDQLRKRFGEKLGDLIPLTAKAYTTESTDENKDAFIRAEVWEIWCMESKKVYWYCKDYHEILDVKDDPLELTGFFPAPRPMIANLTTSAFMPIPDYVLAQDSYNEIDKLETRISKITEAVKVVGVYDSSAEGVKRMMTEAAENDLIPVDSWAMFAEKGGLAGTVQWLPIKEIAETLGFLISRRNDAKALLYEVTGISDIMRGAQAAGGAVSATERQLEARFASVRIQAMQDEFAKYATDLIRLRAEIVAKHFQPESIVEQSNIQFLPADQEHVGAALELIKEKNILWRLEVKPESVAMVDYAQLKQERTDYITALATFLQSASPLVEMEPESAPVLMELLKWGLAGFKGSDSVEGILDQAIARMNAKTAGGQEEQQQPDPEQIKAQAEQARQQFEMQKMQETHKFEREKMAHEISMAEFDAQARSQEQQSDNQIKQNQEQAQASLNMQEETHETGEFIKREQARARINRSNDND